MKNRLVSPPPPPPTQSGKIAVFFFAVLFVFTIFALASCEDPNKPENVYMVNFEANGGIPTPKAQKVAQGGKVAEPLAVAKGGFSFGGWHSDDAFANPWDFGADTVAEDITLYAKWNEISGTTYYTVSFESGEGSTVASQQVAANGTASRPANPTRQGYTFDNWYKETSFSNAYDFETIVTANITLYAKWNAITPVTCTVVFNADGGTPAPQNQTVASGERIAEPPAMTKSGYTFGGWYRENTFATLWNFAVGTVVVNTTLYAKWNPVSGGATFTVTFNSNGGTMIASQTVPQNGKANRPSPEPTRDGYVLENWYSNQNLSNLWNFDTDIVSGDMTLYAGWITAYTVTFIADGGEPAPLPQTVGQGRKVEAPPAMAKTGYTFGGWYKETSFASVWNFANDTVTANVALYAKWTINQYTVTFNADGGAPAPAQRTANHGTTIAAPPAMTKTGYTFGGWYKESGFAALWDFASDTVTASLTLYAKWNAATYTVMFFADGGTPAPAQQTVSYGGKAAGPPAMSKNGYVFAGWHKAAGSVNEWNFANNTVTADTGLYALWAVDILTDGQWVNGNITTDSGGADWHLIPVTAGTTYYLWWNDVDNDSGNKTLDIKVAAYYGNGAAVFDQDTPNNYSFTATSSGTVYIKAYPYSSGKTGTYGITYSTTVSAATFTVTFNANGGEPAPTSPITMNYGSKIAEPKAMTRTGYTFGGWYKESTFATAWNFASNTVAANTTLYAKWNINQYTVTFNADGGTPAPTQRTVNHGATTAAPPTMTRTGYTFGGWYRENSFATPWDFASDTVTANTALYAKWTINQYTVTLNANGGEPAPTSPVTMNYGSKIAEPKAMTRTGYAFGGWYRESTFATLWNFSTDTVTADTALYAKWTINQYTVTFNADGGTPAPTQRTVNHGATTAAPPAMTKTGYTFGGWYRENGFVTPWDFASDTITANTTLYAKWTINQYTATFFADGGMPAPVQQTINHGGKIVEPTAIAKAGYALDGWYREAAFASKWNFNTDTVTEDIALYARWVVAYTVTFNADGGMPAPATQIVASGGKAAVPAAMAKERSVFDAWYKESGFLTKWNFASDTVTANIVLYAKWLPTYSLTIAVAAGQGVYGSAAISTGSVGGGQAIGSVTVRATANSGCYFTKWTSDAAGTIPISTANPYTFTIAADTTLYAVFSIPGERAVHTVNGVSVPLRYVPSGSFQRDGTAANVSVINKGYWMSETQTTQELFQQIMGTNPSNFTSDADSGEVQNRRPVEMVNWYHAIAFCNKLSIADSKQPVYSVSGVSDWASLAYSSIPTSENTAWNAATMDTSKNGYRLPTEMEWMWAAIGADKTVQPNTTGTSKAFAGSDGSNSINDYVWYSGNPDTHSKTHEVAKKLPNELGLYDMSGNVWEWCWDWYGSYPSGTQPDYVGASSGSIRVIRGGCWNYSAGYVRPDNRSGAWPNDRYNYFGFRVLLP